MSLIDQTRRHTRASTYKEALTDCRGYFFPMSMEAKIVWAILAILALWGIAIFIFGVPALVWPMKIIVPGLVLGLVLLT